MGCCVSSPYSKRRYNTATSTDPADLDEDHVPLRYFGTYRVGSNLVPDDIAGLPSTHLQEHLASNKDVLLYQAEIDHGKAMRCFSFQCLCLFTPAGLSYILTNGVSKICTFFSFDEPCCWVRKEYSTRTYFRIYPNRIEINKPSLRFPFGPLGCGSWSGDAIVAHPFDRGAFGFQHVRFGSAILLCCCIPVFGGAVARHRCQCNGPLWNRMCTDCGGWWCDEWPCQMAFCSYRYVGLAYPDEVAFVASIALQAYFEGRVIGPADVQKCIDFWRQSISERWNPVERKRPVCCEPIIVPTPRSDKCYNFTHPSRRNPYPDSETTSDVKDIYETYTNERNRQIADYESFTGPFRQSTLCRCCGCRRCYGRKGCCFCTEGCRNCSRKAGEPAPPFEEHDFDDEWDASTVLLIVLGPPPKNVVIKRWRWDPEKDENYLEMYPTIAENAVLNVDGIVAQTIDR